MDYRNDNRTPRDRVDEEFFRSILRDEELTEDRRRESIGDVAASSSGVTSGHASFRGRGQRSRSFDYGQRVGREKGESVSSHSRCGDCHDSSCPSTASWNDRLKGLPLAMVYIPPQSFKGIMESAVSLKRGTVFTELDMPFYYSGCKGDVCR